MDPLPSTSPLICLLKFSFLTLCQLVQLRHHSKDMPSSFTPQGLCTGCTFCLEHPPPESCIIYSHFLLISVKWHLFNELFLPVSKYNLAHSGRFISPVSIFHCLTFNIFANWLFLSPKLKCKSTKTRTFTVLATAVPSASRLCIYWREDSPDILGLMCHIMAQGILNSHCVKLLLIKNKYYLVYSSHEIHDWARVPASDPRI